jgi:hypothetical protein
MLWCSALFVACGSAGAAAFLLDDEGSAAGKADQPLLEIHQLGEPLTSEPIKQLLCKEVRQMVSSWPSCGDLSYTLDELQTSTIYAYAESGAPVAMVLSATVSDGTRRWGIELGRAVEAHQKLVWKVSNREALNDDLDNLDDRTLLQRMKDEIGEFCFDYSNIEQSRFVELVVELPDPNGLPEDLRNRMQLALQADCPNCVMPDFTGYGFKVERNGQAIGYIFTVATEVFDDFAAGYNHFFTAAGEYLGRAYWDV